MGTHKIHKKEITKNLQELTFLQVKNIAFLTAYKKFCQEKGLEKESDEYIEKFMKDLYDENNLIDLKKLDEKIKGL